MWPVNGTSFMVGMEKDHSLITTKLNYYICIGFILTIAFFLRQRNKNEIWAPFYKASKVKWMFSAETLVRDSYKKFSDSVYQVKSTEGIRTLVPVRLLRELQGLPEDTLSATEAINEAMLSSYTKFDLGRQSDTLSYLVRNKLTQRLARLRPRLKSELEYFLEQEFPRCEDWTPVKLQPVMVRIIARLSGRIFVGPELSRSEVWMTTSTNFAIHVFIAVVKLQFFPPWLRPLAQHLVSEIRQIRRDLATGQALLQPIIEQRLRDEELDDGKGGYQKPEDFIQWLLDALPQEEKRDYYMQTHLHLVLCAAAIHSTGNLTTECLYNLATDEYLQEELRQEALEVLESEGGGEESGWGRKDNMARLRKMDSFIKETQRLAGNVTSFIRKVVKPVSLSDGTHFPAGTHLLAPQCGISRDPRFFGPDADTFDGLRFWRKRAECRSQVAADRRLQFTSIGDTNANFGLGRHACPGRFFAGNEIKMILARFLLDYDIRLREGEGRPTSQVFMMTKSPDPNAEIMLRSRRGRDSASEELKLA